MSDTVPPSGVPLAVALRFWGRLGLINFGGPTGQIAIMHDELVERRRWIDEPRFLHALNFAMLLPGPEAHQLAIYVGWLLNGAPGAIAAGTLFLLPALALIVGLSWVYAVHGDVAWIGATFAGLAWGVVGIVASALVRIGGRTLTTGTSIAIAVLAFTALFVFGVPFPAVIAAAVLAGVTMGQRIRPVGAAGASGPAGMVGADRVRPTWRRSLRVLAVGVVVWLAPLAAVVAVVGTDGVVADEAVFFALMSLITFGGAYAVLAYVNQAAVLRFGWLSSGEMAVGLSLAETTPGPLILVVVFVGFVGAFRQPGDLSPVAAGLAGAFVTAWATFVPSFLWIFLGAPSVERLRGSRRLASALTAVTAAVVGVIANLALVFAIGVLFEDRVTVRFGSHDLVLPSFGSADALAIAVAVAAFFALWRLRVNVVWVVLASGLVGFLRWLA